MAMKNVIRVNPRTKTPELDRCPNCGHATLDLRADGAYQCRTCYYTTKPRVDASLLQSWSGSVFNLTRSGRPTKDQMFGGRLTGLGGVLMLLGIGAQAGPFSVPAGLERFFDPSPPSELAFVGGITIVAILALLALFSGYTMSRGDSKAWRAALPAGLIALVLGILGPGAVLAAIGGVFAAVGGFVGRHGED